MINTTSIISAICYELDTGVLDTRECDLDLLQPEYLREDLPVYASSHVEGYGPYGSHITGDTTLWCAEGPRPHYIEFAFRSKVLITTVDITGGSINESTVASPIKFSLHYNAMQYYSPNPSDTNFLLAVENQTVSGDSL